MNDDSLGSDPSTKLDFINYLCRVLSSDVDVCFAPSIRHEPPPIVTLNEIRNAKDICPSSMGGSKILEINVSTILKVGPMVRMGEAETLYLLKERTSVPVPRVLNAYVIGDIGFILMEKIPGKSLEDCWEDMAEDSQRSIVRQLASFIQEWRRIEGPVFGSVDGGPCEDILFKHSWDAQPRQYGPFQTRKEFNEGVVQALRYSRPQAKLTAKDEPLAEKVLASGAQDERKVLTHGDLHQSNIIVDDDVVTGVIDWGAAGYSIWAREYFGIRWQALDLEWRELTSTLVGVDEYEFWAEVNQSMLDYTGI